MCGAVVGEKLHPNGCDIKHLNDIEIVDTSAMISAIDAIGLLRAGGRIDWKSYEVAGQKPRES